MLSSLRSSSRARANSIRIPPQTVRPLSPPHIAASLGRSAGRTVLELCVCVRARVCVVTTAIRRRMSRGARQRYNLIRQVPTDANHTTQRLIRLARAVLGPHEMIISLLALLFEQRHSSYLKVKLRVRWTGCSSGLIVYFRPSPRISFEVVVGQHVDQSTIRSILLLLLLLLHYYYCYLLIAG